MAGPHQGTRGWPEPEVQGSRPRSCPPHCWSCEYCMLHDIRVGRMTYDALLVLTREGIERRMDRPTEKPIRRVQFFLSRDHRQATRSGTLACFSSSIEENFLEPTNEMGAVVGMRAAWARPYVRSPSPSAWQTASATLRMDGTRCSEEESLSEEPLRKKMRYIALAMDCHNRGGMSPSF